MTDIPNVRPVHSFLEALVEAMIVVAFFVATSATQATAGENCPIPKYIAPLPVSMKPPPPWGQDTGAIVDGYVGLKGFPKMMYGIDLSQNNVIKDYGRYTDCGGKFAFIRLDKAYGTHSKALTSADWTVIPYVYMPIEKS